MKNVNFETTLPVTIFREGDAFVAYTPALDLSSVGDSLEEAQRNFSEAAKLFVETCIEKGTLDDVLADMGWVKRDTDWVPPLVVSHESQVVQIPFHA